MYEVEVISSFAAAHSLRQYKGKCERLHGHNYRVHVTARSSAPAGDGMVIDFGDLKAATNEILDRLDHRFLNEIEPFDKEEPSAENIAAFIFQEIELRLNERGSLLYSVGVWESDTSVARYIRG
ncbi:MAG: 6-carboxytetrahydropterin synthase QueD [Desulfomonilaceae bacterium]